VPACSGFVWNFWESREALRGRDDFKKLVNVLEARKDSSTQHRRKQ